MLANTKIGELIKKLEAISEAQLFIDACKRTVFINEIDNLIREQLLLGTDGNGDSLPRYVDDPFFKSLEHAKAYQKWKEKVSPNPAKDKEVMDLYINGTFHNTIKFLDVVEDGILVDADFTIFGDDLRRYSTNLIGINETTIDKIIPELKTKYLEELHKLLQFN
jgi:hypothetical protein